MGTRRNARIAVSDDEDEPLTFGRSRRLKSLAEEQGRKRKKMRLHDDDDEEEELESRNRETEERTTRVSEEEAEEEEEEEDEEAQEDAKPIGEATRVSGKGRGRRSHYEAFEYDGNRYDLEDPVLLVPEDKKQKPYVAIIKDITQTKDDTLMVTGQWFYRPEEAEKKNGGNWQSCDTRELFYSFHRDEVPAESVMHKCVVHFVPKHKQLPSRKQHPGFIVQKVYDTVERKLWKLTDKDYKDGNQQEIDVFVRKTISRLGNLPDLVPEDVFADQDEELGGKRSFRKKNISPLDVTRDVETALRRDQHQRVETPGSCTPNASEYQLILSNFKVCTGEIHRDRWLERLLQGIRYMFTSSDARKVEERGKFGFSGTETANGPREKDLDGSKLFRWPDDAVSSITALEKAAHEALSSDFLKYNQKLRQLVFNLKISPVLARRLMNKELDPSKILSMSPNELKVGLTAEETAKTEPDDSERMQMTGARCSRCNEHKVGLRDIIQAGHGQRYQLECIACGNSWYASRDEASIMTVEVPNKKEPDSTSPKAGASDAAPSATAKIGIEKKLVSPRESEKAGSDP